MKRDPYRFLADLDWEEVSGLYDARWEAHMCLLDAHDAGPSEEFAHLALGMTDAAANYSAAEHGLGPKILASNERAPQRVWDLATVFLGLDHARDVPKLIRAAGLAYCRVGVGSELSGVINPEVCWVCNVRTLWTQLLVKHGDVERANEELRLYRDQDATSDMYWPTWGALHRRLGRDLRLLTQASEAYCDDRGELDHLWADAISSVVYEELAE
jgi:hypothetical protein